MNCRIGDIAGVIHAVHQENLGVWVSVEKPGPEPGEWVVRLLCVARGRVVGADRVEERTPGALAYCDDVNLQPIRGLRVADPVHSFFAEHVKA